MSEQFTEWFPPSIVPARVGVYETRWVPASRRPNFPQYQYWNGTFWGAWNISKVGAMTSKHHASSRQEPEWRGLAHQPK